MTQDTEHCFCIGARMLGGFDLPGIAGVCKSQNSCPEWDHVFPKAEGIARSIPMLMVMGDEDGRSVQPRHLFDDASTESWVRLHLPIFLGSEFLAGHDQLRRYGHQSKVVEKTRPMEVLELCLRQPKSASKSHHRTSCSYAMASSFGAPALDGCVQVEEVFKRDDARDR
jgi:hypothetical protein